ncbi:MAG: penicillin-binding protein 1C [Acidobacteriota bacterium]
MAQLGTPTRLGAPVRRRLAVCGGLLVSSYAMLWLAARAVPLPARLAEPPSTVVAFDDGSPAHVFLSPDDKYRMAVTPEDLASDGAIDPDYVAALLRFEDKRFEHHPGVDPLALARATALNLRHRRVVSGASTLTMQLVRVLEPRPRSLRSKAIEALRAVQLEARLSKREILAAYLSFIPFGRNVEGVVTASHAYFGHGPQELTLEEIATLLAVPQRPSRRYPSPTNSGRLSQARDEIVDWLRQRGLDEEATELRAPAAVPQGMRPLPRNAPHAAFWLAAKAPAATRIATTLDRGLQLQTERAMRAAHAEMADRGIHNGAVVVVDHRSSEVRALVGNFDFWDGEHGGQIVGFDTPRSPGSALKPFIYALALDRGLALPGHLVPDVPTAYTDYAPSNYDGTFTGLVPLEDALSFSLNIPFVRLLGRLGVERFIGSLHAAGAAGLKPEPGYYGLSAAIGSVEVTPLEVAGLYAGLANGGSTRPLHWLSADSAAAATEIYSPGSAFLTRRALTRRDRPDFPSRRRLSGAPPSIHWKTGTSYGHRDAWAAGSGPAHTAVVWLGNFDNRPSVDLVGAEAAGPLLFDVLEGVADRSRPAISDRPSHDLKRVEVCGYSGYLPTAACEQRRQAWALRQRVPTTRCPYHVAIDVELATGLALNPSCRAGRPYETRNYVVWPASIRRWLSTGHRWLPNPPALAEGCRVAGRRRAPAILSPPAGQILVLLPGIAASDQEVPLQAESGSPGARLSWFIDGELLATVEASERVWWRPEPGRHEIVVMDEAGLSARRQVEVRQRFG